MKEKKYLCAIVKFPYGKKQYTYFCDTTKLKDGYVWTTEKGDLVKVVEYRYIKESELPVEIDKMGKIFQKNKDVYKIEKVDIKYTIIGNNYINTHISIYFDPSYNIEIKSNKAFYHKLYIFTYQKKFYTTIEDDGFRLYELALWLQDACEYMTGKELKLCDNVIFCYKNETHSFWMKYDDEEVEFSRTDLYQMSNKIRKALKNDIEVQEDQALENKRLQPGEELDLDYELDEEHDINDNHDDEEKFDKGEYFTDNDDPFDDESELRYIDRHIIYRAKTHYFFHIVSYFLSIIELIYDDISMVTIKREFDGDSLFLTVHTDTEEEKYFGFYLDMDDATINFVGTVEHLERYMDKIKEILVELEPDVDFHKKYSIIMGLYRDSIKPRLFLKENDDIYKNSICIDYNSVPITVDSIIEMEYIDLPFSLTRMLKAKYIASVLHNTISFYNLPRLLDKVKVKLNISNKELYRIMYRLDVLNLTANKLIPSSKYYYLDSSILADIILEKITTTDTISDTELGNYFCKMVCVGLIDTCNLYYDNLTDENKNELYEDVLLEFENDLTFIKSTLISVFLNESNESIERLEYFILSCSYEYIKTLYSNKYIEEKDVMLDLSMGYILGVSLFVRKFENNIKLNEKANKKLLEKLSYIDLT